MPLTVAQAFKQFITEYIDIDPETNTKAKASRSWLIDKINEFDSSEGFFQLYKDITLPYGSYARKTKIPVLDDIDIMIGLHGNGCTYNENDPYSDVNIYVPATAIQLLSFRTDGTDFLNSRKIINAFVNKLEQVPQYRKAEVKRNQEACTLDLTAHDWTFDIVPAFITSVNFFGKSYYLIPNGSGKWMKTDPRNDKENLDSIDTNHNKIVRKMIRLLKYWQRRTIMPQMQSYLLEVITINYYKSKFFQASEMPHEELIGLFKYFSEVIYQNVADPQGIKANINNVTFEDQKKISLKAAEDYIRAREAITLSSNGEEREAINKWKEIFGESFPKYE